MGWLRRILGPPNSVVLLYDHMNDEAGRDLPGLLDEVGRYYEFTPLRSIVSDLKRGKDPRGKAAIALAYCRKSTLLRGVPELLARRVPFSVFLREDCVGMNRLPLDEELKAFASAYPEKLPAAECAALVDKAWHSPGEIARRLQDFRRSIGPLPVGDIDPTAFFPTWGELTKLPPGLVDFGLAIHADPCDHALLESSVAYARRQADRPIEIAFCARPLRNPADSLASLGLSALQTLDDGAIEKSTDRWALPRWMPN